MLGWIMDHVPWWVPLIVGGGGIGAALFFVPGLLPALLRVWAALPTPVKWVLTGGAVAFFTWWAGRNVGRRNAAEAQRRRDAEAWRRRRETNAEVGKMTDEELDRELEKNRRKGE